MYSRLKPEGVSLLHSIQNHLYTFYKSSSKTFFWRTETQVTIFFCFSFQEIVQVAAHCCWFATIKTFFSSTKPWSHPSVRHRASLVLLRLVWSWDPDTLAKNTRARAHRRSKWKQPTKRKPCESKPKPWYPCPKPRRMFRIRTLPTRKSTGHPASVSGAKKVNFFKPSFFLDFLLHQDLSSCNASHCLFPELC